MRVLAIASAGGHWIQLLRLMPAMAGHEMVYASTRASFAETVPGHSFYTVPDASRWNKLRLFYMAFVVLRLVMRLKPGLIVTTGAAPGLMAILAGRMLGVRTVWIDSIANVERLSMSGNIAQYIAHRCYTQWPELANTKTIYHGNVLT